MPKGPVPSESYDILKALRGDSIMGDIKSTYEKYFKIIGNYHVKALEEPDMDEFSKSELDAIEYSLEYCSGKNSAELSELSHDEAWEKGQQSPGSKISEVRIAKAGGAKDDILKYIIHNRNIDNTVFV